MKLGKFGKGLAEPWIALYELAGTVLAGFCDLLTDCSETLGAAVSVILICWLLWAAGECGTRWILFLLEAWRG